MQVSDERLNVVAQKLYADVYEAEFRGKGRGRFCVSRDQLKQALDVERLHASTIERLQDAALARGLVIIDLDDLFPCIEVEVVRRYRRPPSEVFARFFPEEEAAGISGEGDDDE